MWDILSTHILLTTADSSHGTFLPRLSHQSITPSQGRWCGSRSGKQMVGCQGAWQEMSLQKSSLQLGQHYSWHSDALRSSVLVIEGMPPSCMSSVYPHTPCFCISKNNLRLTSCAALWPHIEQKKTLHWLLHRDCLLSGTDRIQFELRRDMIQKKIKC